MLGELHGVAAQVDQHLAQPDGVHPHPRQRCRRRIEQQLDSLGSRACREHLHRLLDELDQVTVDRVELQAARLDLGEVQHVVDDRQQRVGRAVNGFGKASLGLVEARVHEQTGHAQHAIHRRTQLMAHAGHEIALGPAQDLQLRVAFLELARTGAHGVLELAAVAQLALATQPLQAPQVAEDQQGKRYVGHPRGCSIPGRRRDMHRNRKRLLAGGAVGVGGSHLEDVLARVQVRVGRAVQRPGVDPGGIETLEPIGVAVVGRRSEVERGELEAQELVIIREQQRSIRARHVLARQRVVELRRGGQHHPRRRCIRGDRLRQEGVETVVAAEEQRAVAGLIVGIDVEFLALQAVRFMKDLERAGARIETSQAVVRAEPQAVFGVGLDSPDDLAGHADRA